MTHLKALGILALTSLATLSIDAGSASAITIAGMAAKVSSPADDTCANFAYGAVANDCSTTKTFLIPMTIATTGYKTVKFRAKGAASTNNVGCRGTAMNDDHTGYWATSTVYLSQFGTAQEVSLGTLNVGGAGAVYLNCSIDNGGKLLRAEWDE